MMDGFATRRVARIQTPNSAGATVRLGRSSCARQAASPLALGALLPVHGLRRRGIPGGDSSPAMAASGFPVGNRREYHGRGGKHFAAGHCAPAPLLTTARCNDLAAAEDQVKNWSGNMDQDRLTWQSPATSPAPSPALSNGHCFPARASAGKSQVTNPPVFEISSVAG